MEYAIGFLAALGIFIPIAVAAYRTIRKGRSEDKTADVNLTEAQRAARTKERRQDERTARDEYRDLYNEVKEELIDVRASHIKCERWCARIEAALIAAKIPLPPE